MVKVLVVTTTCNKFLHRIDAIKNTWSKECDNHLFFIGGDKFERRDNLIYLECNDSYEYLTQKTRKLFEYCIEHETFDYILKTNDDSYIDIKKFLNSNFYNFEYGGYVCSKTIDYKSNENLNFQIDDTTIKCDKKLLDGKTFNYGTGGFYFISKKAINLCLKNKVPCDMKTFDNTSVEDLVVGVMLHNADIKNILNLNHNPKIDLPYDISIRGMSIHPVHYKIMNDLYTNKDNFNNQLTVLKYKAYLSDYIK